TSAPTITISGTLAFGTDVIVTTPVGSFSYPVVSGEFTALDIPLKPNALNSVYFVGSGYGETSPPVTSMIVQDSTPPITVIQIPQPGAEIATETTEVMGTVSDNLSGLHPMTVTVNGQPAAVDQGIGTTGTFLFGGLMLDVGENVITVVSSDFLGNEATQTRTVTRVLPEPGAPTLTMVAGNLQVAPVLTVLPQALVVQVSNGDGTPFAGKLVTFEVTLNDGVLSSDGISAGSVIHQAITDANGQASAYWRIGSTAGEAVNRVRVSSAGIPGSLTFCATGVTSGASQINVGDGNGQYVAAGAPAPLPLRAWVSDGNNGVEGITVVYRVLSGGGTVGIGTLTGQTELAVQTFEGGYCEAIFTLGTTPGIQVVEAFVASEPSLVATFTLFGLDADPGSPTRWAGTILDNGNRPISGAAAQLHIGTQVFETFSDASGEFEFPDLPTFGPGVLVVDGRLATQVGTETVPVGSFPSISYQVVVVEHADNRLGRPVLLPRLDPTNERVYDGTQDIALTIEGVEGLVVQIPA
ncbi:MAG: hypothetical protein KDB69_08595, partial [Acidimicrobiia bacterium]|nr:hypothetical protein [Acidimicrobiia bacterium]